MGVVNLGLGGLITEIVELMAGGNLYLLLGLTALACLVMGMGPAPPRPPYIVMASLMAVVIVEPGGLRWGWWCPLISAHLFVFYFGILADGHPAGGPWPPTRAAPSPRSNPIPTGPAELRLRHAHRHSLPFMFIFNSQLLLIGVESWWMAAWVMFSGLAAMFAFAGATQGYLAARCRWYETVLLLGVTAVVLQPAASARALGLASMGGRPGPWAWPCSP